MTIRTSLTALALVAVLAFPAVSLAVDPAPIPIPGRVITLGDVVDQIEYIVNLGIEVAALAVVAMIIYAGFMMATSRGEEAKYKKGKEMLKYAIYGALVVFGAGLIVNTIVNVTDNPTGF